MKIDKRLLELDESSFIELLETGQLYKLYPELKGQLFNIQQFNVAKEQYQNVLEAEGLAEDLFLELAAMTGADPAELYEVLENNIDQLNFVIQTSDMFDIESVFQQIREELA